MSGKGIASRAIDYRTPLRHTTRMIHSTKKFVAVLMLLWLPIFTGSALAASVSMQLQQGGCHDSAMAETMTHEDMGMGEHHMHHGQAPVDKHNPSCSNCGVCHLACTAYLAVTGVAVTSFDASALESTPYLVVFHSHTSAPLVPPPLGRA